MGEIYLRLNANNVVLFAFGANSNRILVLFVYSFTIVATGFFSNKTVTGRTAARATRNNAIRRTVRVTTNGRDTRGTTSK